MTNKKIEPLKIPLSMVRKRANEKAKNLGQVHEIMNKFAENIYNGLDRPENPKNRAQVMLNEIITEILDEENKRKELKEWIKK